MKFEILGSIGPIDSPIAKFASASADPDIIKSMRDAFSMTKQRCYNPKCSDYRFYGGRGIRICIRWLESFDNFIVDMGLRPEGMTLERLDVNGDYCPENCTWATRKQQTGNRRETLKLTSGGVTRTLSEWAEISGISYHTLKARKQRLGYTDEECLGKEVKYGEVVPGRVYKTRKKPDMSKVPKGFDSRLQRFNRDEVAEIQARYIEKGESFTSLSKVFGGSVSLISDICQKKGRYVEVNKS